MTSFGCELAEPAAEKPVLHILVAASTAHVIDPLMAGYAQDHGVTVVCNASSSSTLARQIEQGAPADLFLSANLKWMDYLEERGLVRSDTRRHLLGNRLALIAPADSDVSATDVIAVLSSSVTHLAMGDPDHVPAGMYARQALTAMGLWDSLADRVLPAKDVRSALVAVERGEAELGIVYATDAASSGRVRLLGYLPEEVHEPVRYPIALTASAGLEAAALLNWLSGPACRAAFEAAGFAWLGEPSP